MEREDEDEHMIDSREGNSSFRSDKAILGKYYTDQQSSIL